MITTESGEGQMAEIAGILMGVTLCRINIDVFMSVSLKTLLV